MTAHYESIYTFHMNEFSNSGHVKGVVCSHYVSSKGLDTLLCNYHVKFSNRKLITFMEVIISWKGCPS